MHSDFVLAVRPEDSGYPFDELLIHTVLSHLFITALDAVGGRLEHPKVGGDPLL